MTDNAGQQPYTLDAHGQRRRQTQPGRTRAIAFEVSAKLAEASTFTLPQDRGDTTDDKLLEKLEAQPEVAKAFNLFRARIAADAYWHAPNRSSRPIVPYYKGLMDECQNFTQFRLALANGFLEGRAGGRIIGGTVRMRLGNDTVERTWWVPRWIVPIGKPQMELGFEEIPLRDAQTGQTYKRRRTYWQVYDLFEQKWFRVEPHQANQYCFLTWGTSWDTLMGGRGKLHEIAQAAKDLQHLREYAVRGALRFAYPLLIVNLAEEEAWAHPDGDGDDLDSAEQLAQEIADALKKTAGGQVLVVPGTTKVMPVSMDGSGSSALVELLRYNADVIVSCLLGASMPSGGGPEGSRARAAVEQGTVDDNIRPYRHVEEHALRPIAKLIWEMNRENWIALGLSELTPPELKLGQERIDNPADAEARLRAAADLGLPVGHEHAYELLQLEPPTDEEMKAGEVIGLPAPPEPMVDPMTGEELDPMTGEPLVPPVLA